MEGPRKADKLQKLEKARAYTLPQSVQKGVHTADTLILAQLNLILEFWPQET